MTIAEKISLLNNATLESINESDKLKIIERLTDAGLKILGADYGFMFWKQGSNKEYQLAYKSPKTPYEPNLPRRGGYNSRVEKSKVPYMGRVLKEKIAKYDLTSYMKSIVIVPIFYKKHTYGNLVLCYQNTHRFSEEDRSLSIALGNAAAQAITVNQLYGNLRDFKNTLDETFDSIFIFDPETLKVEYVNEGAARQLELPKKEIYKKTLFDLQTAYTKHTAKELLNPLFSGTITSQLFETELIGRNHKKTPAEFFLQYVTVKNQSPKLLSIVRDVTERKEAEESIRYYAYYDALTGLPNRVLFSEQFAKAIENIQVLQGKLAVLFVDLDRFKFINDVLGHIIGDKLLIQVAHRMQKCLGPKDMISRLGGDEFIMYLGDIIDESDVLRVAQCLQDAFKDPFIIDGHEIFISISIGVSMFPADGKDIVTLLKSADSALQRAKDHGGNNFQQYHAGITVPHQMHLELEKQLRNALSHNELVLHYQPQIEAQTDRIVSCEALVRWNHPDLGLIFPDQFIGYAEDSGLIIPMGEWILEQACQQAQAWRDQGLPPLTLTVNLSPRQLLQQGLVETVSNILKKTGLPPSQLELEITERVLMRNIDASVEILSQLKNMGIKLSVDDFGTGYASLSYLRKLPVDKIKIDRSFIHGSLTNLQDAAIITAIITIAHQLKLEVVAEGVETLKQREFLQQQHCDYIQGNLFSKAVSAAEFSALFGKRQADIVTEIRVL